MDEYLESEDRILRMLLSQYVGIYQLNMNDKKVLCLQDGERALDISKTVGLDVWMQRLVDSCHCEDRDKLLDLVSDNALEKFADGQEERQRKDVRIIHNGQYKWIHITLMHNTKNIEERKYIIVTLRDVTHRYKYNSIIREKNAQLQKLLQTTEQYKDALMTEAIVLYQVNFSKDTIENDIVQRKKNEIIKVLDTVDISTPCSYDEYCRRWSNRVSDDTMDNYRRLSTSAKMIDEYNKGTTLLTIDYRTIDTQNEEMWINKTVYLTKDNATGDIIGIVSLRNANERYRQEFLRESLAKQAAQDLLTGLYNHVTGELLIRSRMDSEASMASAFIIFDIDRFKQVNDTYGHYFGDCVLQSVAANLKECIR